MKSASWMVVIWISYTFLFRNKVNISDHHRFVHGFAHIVNGKEGNGNRRQGFHFDAGLPGAFCHGRHFDAGLIGYRRHVDLCDLKRVAQGDQLAGPLPALDTGDLGNGEYIALLYLVITDQLQGATRKCDVSFGNGGPYLFRSCPKRPPWTLSPRWSVCVSFFILRCC